MTPRWAGPGLCSLISPVSLPSAPWILEDPRPSSVGAPRWAGVLGGRRAAAVVEGVGGHLGGAGHRGVVHPAVQVDDGGLGGHGGVAVVR